VVQARLLVMHAARCIDEGGAKSARREIAMIKAVVPLMAQQVVDRAMQVHGAAGFSGDTPLAYLWSHARWLRMADGPDDVHFETVAKMELKGQMREPTSF
jgi:acyl-CoA dehydrogenase